MNRHSFGQFFLAAILFLSAAATVVYLPIYSGTIEHDRLEQRARAVASGLLEQYGSEMFSGNAATNRSDLQ